ncbi:hypothetical protein [Pedobacter antarcticus]|uniref:hypothetical protein n=1 Tax=Pedobacter antarcticus TaxID=34086 RepID=UPI00088276BC|nr:hypothetical protein [Pedobacter antarcticus]SDM39866.1 hypothetical protein SAMN04488084_106148 [Pedobacter antarcticus]
MNDPKITPRTWYIDSKKRTWFITGIWRIPLGDPVDIEMMEVGKSDIVTQPYNTIVQLIKDKEFNQLTL